MDHDIEKDLRIDTEALDVEWLDQPMLYMKYSELEAEANLIAKRAAERFKTIRSELRLEAAEGGEELIGAKPTNDNVDAWVRAHKRYQKAKELQLEAEYEAELCNGAKFAFHQRKSALENLVQLMLGQYFAGPSAPRNLTNEYNVHQAARDQVNKIAVDKAKKAAKKKKAKKMARRTK